MSSRRRWAPILYVIGLLLIGLAGVMVVPAAVDLSAGNPDWRTFATAAAATFSWADCWRWRTARTSSTSTYPKALS